MKQDQNSEPLISLIQRLMDDGSIDRLVNAGFMSPKVLGYYEMYTQFDINRRIKNMKPMEAKYSVCVKFNCEISTVKRAIHIMQQHGAKP